MIERSPWDDPVDPLDAVIVHELSARTGSGVHKTWRGEATPSQLLSLPCPTSR
jgi:hypothetical protein